MTKKEFEITDKLFELAKELEPVANARMIAAVVQKNKIISIGINQKKSHPRAKELQENNEKIYLHAEMAAILQAERTHGSLEGMDIYIIRAKRDGGGWTYGTSMPCKACYQLITEVGIKNVYATTK